MAKVYMTCGKICSGKSTYSQKLRKLHGAVILSVDEITLALFGKDVGEKHDLYVERAEKYLFEKSVEIIESGINVILDWGFWTKRERDFARKFYGDKKIECEFHYIDITDEEWARRLEKRNAAITAGELDAYYVDEGLTQKFKDMFEVPEKSEIDVWEEK